MAKRLIFQPRKFIRAKYHIGLVVDEELRDKAKVIADKYNMSLKELARQAFVFALEHMGGEDDES